MGFVITDVVFYAECECPKCGHQFNYEEAGTAYVNEMYKLDEVVCPECGTWFDEDTEAEDLEDEDNED